MVCVKRKINTDYRICIFTKKEADTIDKICFLAHTNFAPFYFPRKRRFSQCHVDGSQTSTRIFELGGLAPHIGTCISDLCYTYHGSYLSSQVRQQWVGFGCLRALFVQVTSSVTEKGGALSMSWGPGIWPSDASETDSQPALAAIRACTACARIGKDKAGPEGTRALVSFGARTCSVLSE